MDAVARSFVFSELGCFSENQRQRGRALQYACAREDAPELTKHTRKLRTFLKKQLGHESISVRRPRFYIPRRYITEAEGYSGTLGKMLELEIAHLEQSVAQIVRALKKHGKWDARGMFLSQEFVTRRSAWKIATTPPSFE